MIQLFTLGAVELRGDDGGSRDSFLSGSKRLALLAYLAVSRPRGFQRRDTLLALLWPESDQKRARGALRNLLHQVRKSLGEELIVSRGDEEIGIAEGMLWCDVHALEAEIQRGRFREALEFYRGNLLEGFIVPDAAPAYEHWLDEERTRLRRLVSEAAWKLAAEDEGAGNAAGAAYWGRRAASLTPLSETSVRRLMELLERIEDRAGALRAYEEFVVRLAEELEAEPSEKTKELADRFRSAPGRADPGSAKDSTKLADGDDQSDHAILGASAKPTAGAGTAESLRQAPPTEPAQSGPILRGRRGRRKSMAVALALVFAAVLGGSWVFASRSEPTATAIAVLPFRNLGPPQDAYLSDGITGELTAQIARSGGVRVMSGRAVAAYQGTERSDQEIARELGVNILLRGGVRRDGDRLHVRAQLVDATSGERLWTEESTRAASDLFVVPDELAARASAVLSSISSLRRADTLPDWQTEDPRAYDLFLRGRDLAGQGNGENEAAIEFFRQALRYDSGFADAHAELAGAYALRVRDYGSSAEWADSATVAARRAIELSPDREAGYVALGLGLRTRGRLRDAVAAYRRAQAINPNNGVALDALGVISIVQGRYDDAVHWLGEAQKRDPRSGYRAMELGGAYWELGEDERARQWYDRAKVLGYDGPFLAALRAFDAARRGDAWPVDSLLSLHPKARSATHASGLLAGFAGQWPDARRSFEGLYHQVPDARLVLWGPTVRTSYAMALERTGDRERAASLLGASFRAARLEWDRGIEAPAVPMEIAAIHAVRGQDEDAYQWLERAYAAGERRYRTLRLDPAFASLHGEERFQRLLARMGSDVKLMRQRVGEAYP